MDDVIRDAIGFFDRFGKNGTCHDLHVFHGDDGIDCWDRSCWECRDAYSRHMIERLKAVERRLMPEGMEWPRYEDGEPVQFGDETNLTDAVESITLNADGTTLVGDKHGDFDAKYVQCVRRPAVLAADGEPLEVGQTVWNINNGMEFSVSRLPKPGEYQAVEVRYRNGSSTSFDPCQLTHQRPVLDADGNRIEPAMDVWWVCEGDERGIHAERLHVESIGDDGFVTCAPCNGGTWVELEPSELYVKKPALDADGVLCREGDEVWEVRSHRRREIVGTNYCDHRTGEPLILCDGDDAVPIPATCVTHTKPEPPDSWERIEEDEVDELVDALLDTCNVLGHDVIQRPQPSCDRDALLELADEMEQETGSVCGVCMGKSARRIREALGVEL